MVSSPSSWSFPDVAQAGDEWRKQGQRHSALHTQSHTPTHTRWKNHPFVCSCKTTSHLFFLPQFQVRRIYQTKARVWESCPMFPPRISMGITDKRTLKEITEMEGEKTIPVAVTDHKLRRWTNHCQNKCRHAISWSITENLQAYFAAGFENILFHFLKVLEQLNGGMINSKMFCFWGARDHIATNTGECPHVWEHMFLLPFFWGGGTSQVKCHTCCRLSHSEKWATSRYHNSTQTAQRHSISLSDFPPFCFLH